MSLVKWKIYIRNLFYKNERKILKQRLDELEMYITAPEQAELKKYLDNPFEFPDNYHVGNEALREFRAAEIEIGNIKYQLMTPKEKKEHAETWEKIRIRHEGE